MDSKRKGLRLSFVIFQRIYLPDGRMNETVGTVEELIEFWKAGAMDGTPRFLMTVIELKCSYLFQLFEFYCLLVQQLLFFFWEFISSCFFPLLILSEK